NKSFVVFLIGLDRSPLVLDPFELYTQYIDEMLLGWRLQCGQFTCFLVFQLLQFSNSLIEACYLFGKNFTIISPPNSLTYKQTYRTPTQSQLVFAEFSFVMQDYSPFVHGHVFNGLRVIRLN